MSDLLVTCDLIQKTITEFTVCVYLSNGMGSSPECGFVAEPEGGTTIAAALAQVGNVSCVLKSFSHGLHRYLE